jgi:hypothetical protein
MAQITVDLNEYGEAELDRWLQSAAVAVNPGDPQPLDPARAVRAMIAVAITDTQTTGLVIETLRTNAAGDDDGNV